MTQLLAAPGSRRDERRACAKWLTPICSSSPSAVSVNGLAITPALLMSTSSVSCALRYAAAPVATDLRELRSRTRGVTSAVGCAALSFATAASAEAAERVDTTTLAPCNASTRAVS